MYKAYYGLTKKPFKLTPDSKVVFRSEAHQEALAILKYGVLGKKGFLVLTANVGLGKTTLLEALVESLGTDVKLCLLNNPLSCIGMNFFPTWQRSFICLGTVTRQCFLLPLMKC